MSTFVVRMHVALIHRGDETMVLVYSFDPDGEFHILALTPLEELLSAS